MLVVGVVRNQYVQVPAASLPFKSRSVKVGETKMGHRKSLLLC